MLMPLAAADWTDHHLDHPGCIVCYIQVAAEKKAWEVAGNEGIDMIAVHPAYVWGPPAAKEAGSFNTERLRGVLKGEQVRKDG